MTDRSNRAFRRYTLRHLKRRAYALAIATGRLPSDHHCETRQWALRYAERHGGELPVRTPTKGVWGSKVSAARLRGEFDAPELEEETPEPESGERSEPTA